KVCLSTHSVRHAPDTHRAKMKLASGWNELRVRTSSGSSGMGFWFAIEDPGDLAFATEKRDLVWPKELSIRADQCAGVNSWEKAKDVPLPDEPKLTLAGQGNIRRAFVKWPTIKIPEGLKLKSAEIVLTQAFQREGEKAKVLIAPADAAWEEATLTHATQPKRGAFLGRPAMVVDKEWSFSGNDVTALVRRWIENPNLNFGICVSSDIIQYAAFFSDDTPAQAPKLILQFE
ncbi:MAG: DNRLRE domain-containing protein, partial [Terrimicrobiaceae bacterium]